MISNRRERPRLAVVGHLVYDRIIFPGGKTTEALGGISYNMAALAGIIKEGRLLPVCEIGEDIKGVFRGAFGSTRSLDSSGLKYTSLPNVVNTLVYDDKGDRQEWNSRKPRPLRLAHVAADFDAVIFNFISGDDVTLDEIRTFRRRFDGLIFCDFHSLALGRGSDGRRFFRKHPRWDEYLSPMDMVQMNLAEFATIAGPVKESAVDVASRLSIIHHHGPETVILTMGRKGFLLSIGAGSEVYSIPAIEIPDEVDSTGCGDTLAAAIVYYYTVSGDILQAAMKANLHAAAKATFSGIDGFKRIDGIIDSLGRPTEPVRII